jgi:hypothetical protein
MVREFTPENTMIGKSFTTYPAPGSNLARVGSSLPEWATHPSLIAARDGLDHFHYWVAHAVLPIAFRWIDEHYEEVYERIGYDLNKDDVGVVIAAALQVMEANPLSAERMEKINELKKKTAEGIRKAQGRAYEEGPFDPTGINVVWRGITEELRTKTASIFNARSGTLDDTNGYE